jgi:hypothetical protein
MRMSIKSLGVWVILGYDHPCIPWEPLKPIFIDPMNGHLFISKTTYKVEHFIDTEQIEGPYGVLVSQYKATPLVQHVPVNSYIVRRLDGHYEAIASNIFKARRNTKLHVHERNYQLAIASENYQMAHAEVMEILRMEPGHKEASLIMAVLAWKLGHDVDNAMAYALRASLDTKTLLKTQL